jgi:predicted 3-demethylubiquinone-9 3-methyltransferase (glyoxalase superfamily)
MQKIVPNLWFDTQAEEAARFYVSLFANSKVGAISRYGKDELPPVSTGHLA